MTISFPIPVSSILFAKRRTRRWRRGAKALVIHRDLLHISSILPARYHYHVIFADGVVSDLSESEAHNQFLVLLPSGAPSSSRYEFISFRKAYMDYRNGVFDKVFPERQKNVV